MSFEESFLKRGASSLFRVLGSYALGVVLMGVMLIETFYGTLYQTQPHAGLTSAEAAESFFGSSFVLIPLGGENAVLALPLPGMWIVCLALFANLLVGGLVRARKGRKYWGVLVAHCGVIFLLLSVFLGNRMSTSIDSINLVPGREYRNELMDFGLRLNRFTPEFYPGTGKPKSFESDITITGNNGDELERGYARMNEPFRVSGWTFYQMSYYPVRGGYVSVLRGLHNPFEQWPKWGAYVILGGLLWHFGTMFALYLKRGGERKSETVQEEQPAEPPKFKRKWTPWVIAGVVVAVLGVGLMSAKPKIERVKIEGYVPWSPAFVEEMGNVAVEDGGRLKPFSTYAGFCMLRSLGKRSLTIETDAGARKLSPVEWALDCMFRPGFSAKYPVFLVDRAEVVSRLGLPGLPEKRKRYSYGQLAEHSAEIYKQALLAERMKKPGDVEREIVGLAQNFRRIQLWMMMPVQALRSPENMSGEWFPAWFGNGEGWTASPSKNQALLLAKSAWLDIRAGEGQSGADNARTGIEGNLKKAVVDPNRTSLTDGERRLLSLESFYYAVEPIYAALVLFIFGFVLFVIASLSGGKASQGGDSRVLRFCTRFRGVSPAWMIGLLGGLVLLGGMLLRMMITMRSPVGNTYETIAFVACAVLLISLVAEAVAKRGIAIACGLAVGVFGCQMAIMYEAGQATDHMDPLVAVLRSNFLLSTHVITIVLGYAAGLLSGVFSHMFVLCRPFHVFTAETERSLTRMAYGSLCFSLAFIIAGTVFGGIWGNEAWGRFWGWDPKENGALLIILWQLMILHARMGGYIREWGLHIGNMLGVLLIGFAWWGVNALGVGLHSYGFSDAGHPLMIFYCAEACVVVIALAIRHRQTRLG